MRGEDGFRGLIRRLFRSYFSHGTRQYIPAKPPRNAPLEHADGVAFGRRDHRPGGVEVWSEDGATANLVTQIEDRRSEASEIENRGDAAIEECSEVLLGVRQLSRPERCRAGAGMRVDVDEPGQQRSALAVDLGQAGRAYTRRRDVRDPAIPDNDVAKAFQQHPVPRVEYSDSPKHH